MEISLPVTLAVLGAALLHAAWNALVKSSTDTELESTTVAAGAGVIAVVAAPFLPVPARESWPWLAGSVVVHILYFPFLAAAYRYGELSYAYPIMRGGGPVIVAVVGAVALGEVLAPAQTAAVVLISAGVLGFAYGAHDRRATFFALANAVVIATYTLFDAQGARASGAPVSYTLWFFFFAGVVIVIFTIARRGHALPRYLAANWRRGLGAGLCAVGAYAIALWAMTRAPVALVAVLRETSVIFAAAIGTIFLKEKLTRRRIVATGAVLAGLVALRL